MYTQRPTAINSFLQARKAEVAVVGVVVVVFVVLEEEATGYSKGFRSLRLQLIQIAIPETLHLMAGCVIASRLLPCIQKDWDWFRSEGLVSCLSFALTDVRNCGNLYYQSIWPWDAGTASAMEYLQKGPVGQTVTSAISFVLLLQVHHRSIKKKTLSVRKVGNQAFFLRGNLGTELRAVPAQLKMLPGRSQHIHAVSVPMLTPGIFPSYEKDKNKKIYAALCLVLCVCFAALRLENCSSKSSGSCDNVESSSSVTQQSADSQCYHSMSSIE